MDRYFDPNNLTAAEINSEKLFLPLFTLFLSILGDSIRREKWTVSRRFQTDSFLLRKWCNISREEIKELLVSATNGW